MARRPRFLVLSALTAIAAATFALIGADAFSTPRLPLVVKNGTITQLPTGDTLTGSGLIPLPITCSAGSALQSVSATGTPTCIAASGGGGTGTVTNVATGTGLTGGPITTTGTLSLNINSGTTQTCTFGQAVTSMTGAGITSCTAFGTSSLTNGAGNNVVPKSNGTNLIASSLSDNGTLVSTVEGITADSGNRVFDAVGTGLARDGTSAFQVDLNMTGASCSTNTVMTALGATGTGTCAAPPAVTSALAGYAPASGGGTTNFLRADGAWAAPTGGVSGGVTGTTPVWASSTTLGNGTTTDNGTTFKVGNVAGTIVQDSTATGTTNDYALGATTTVLVFTNATGPTLTGIAGGVAGRLLYVGYGNSTSATFSNENASSAAANRIHCPTNANCILSANGAGLWLVYDDTLSRWRPVFTTTLPILTVSGAATMSSTLAVNGNATMVKTTVNGSSGNNSLIANLASTTQVASLAAFDANNSGTFNTTSGALTAYGVNSTVSAARSSGANNLTDIAGYFTASGGQVNQALVCDAGDVILNNTSGTTTIQGATTINGTTTHTAAVTMSTASTATSALQVNNANTAQTAGGISEVVNDFGSYDTTAGVITDTAVEIIGAATRSAGANVLTDVGLLIDVSHGQVNYSIRTNKGDESFNETSGAAVFHGTVEHASTTQLDDHLITHTAAVPVLSTCGASPVIDASSTDLAGLVTMGAATTTACTLTFHSTFTTVPYCVCGNTGSTTTEPLVACVPTATTLVFAATSATNAGKFSYVCVGH